MKQFVFICSLLLANFTLSAQNVHWGGVLDVYFNDNIFDIQADNDNNLIVVGQFSGTVDFDPGPGVMNMTAASNGEDIFVAKYDSVGTYLWSHSFGTGFFYDECDRVAIDTAGNIFITGMWNGTIDFDPDPGNIFNVSSNNSSRSRFLAKYDPNGNFIAAKNVGNAVGNLPSSQDGQSGLGCDDNGNVYMSGFYGTSLTLGPGVTLPVSGLSDNYFAKFDSQLNLIWAHRLGSTETEYSQGLYVHPSGRIIVLGSFRNTIDFDPGPGVFNMTQISSTQEGYFASYDSSGQFLFAKQLTAGTSASPIATLIDGEENIIVTGSCAGIMDADPGVDSTLVGEGWNDQAFVAAYDSIGNFRWAHAYGDVNSFNAIRYVGVDTANNIYVAGNYNPMMDINPGVDTAVFGNINASYVSSFDTAGNFRSAFSVEQVRMRIKNNDIYLAGGFYGLFDFDPGPQIYPLQGDTVNTSWYLLRMHLCDTYAASPGTINIPAICIGDTVTLSVSSGGPQYLWEFTPGFTPIGSVNNDTVVVVVDSNAVQVTVFVSSVGGCMNSPEVYTVVDVHQPVIPTIVFWGDSIHATTNAIFYQWLNSGNSIPGANDSTYVPIHTGYYSVMVIDSNGCSAVSNTLFIIILDVSSLEPTTFSILQNPFMNNLVINSNAQESNIIVTDVSGKIIINGKLNFGTNIFQTDNWSQGVYFLNVQNKLGSSNQKIIKY